MATVGSVPFFTPNQISGCQLWLDASDRTTIQQTGGVVSQWSDKSSSRLIFTQATSAARPSLNTTGPFQNSIYFTSSQTMSSSNTGTLGVQQSWFVVFNSGNGGFFIEQSANTNSSNGSFLNGTNNDLYFIRRTNGVNYIDDSVGFGTSPFASNTSYIASFVNDNTSSGVVWRINGVSRATTFRVQAFNALSGNVTDNFYINSRVPSNIYHAEIIVFNAALSLSIVQQVEGYLAWKWGLQWALPTSHPYKSSPIPPLLNPYPYTDWTPLQVSGCQLWLDAADTNTLTLSGSTVTQWRDKSGVGNNATGGVSPTYASSGVVFNGTNQFLQTNLTAVPSNETIFCVFNLTGTSTRNYDMVAGSANNSRGFQVLNTGSGFFLKWDVWGVAGYAPTAAGTVVVGTTYLGSGTYSGGPTNGTANTFLSGGAFTGGPATFTVSGTATTRIGSGNGGDFFQGTIYEVVSYNVVLSTSQRQQVEGYLAWKWGLQGNLPSNHPYKNSPVPLVLTAPTIAPIAVRNPIASFNPLLISGCQLWIDASQDTTANGAFVNTIPDRSTSSYTISATTNNTITMVRSGLNGLPYYNFGANRARILNFAWRTKFTMFIISRANSGNFLFALWDTGASTYRQYVYGGNWVAMYLNSSLELYDSVLPIGTSITGTNWNIFAIGYDNVGTSAYNYAINGTARSTIRNQGTFPQSDVTLTNTLFINGNGNNATDTSLIAEILLYNGNISNTSAQQIEGYLAWKWGLQSLLPSNHPFKNNGPTNTGVATIGMGRWQPTQISGCALWLDGADRTTVTLSGSTVTQWRDKSGNGNNTSTVSGSPSYTASSILLNGSSTYLVGPYVNTTTTLTAFVIGTVNFSAGVYSAFYRLLSVGSTAANDYNNVAYSALILHEPNTTNIGGYRNFQTNYVSVTTNTTFLLAQQYSGTNATLYLNGTQGGQVASSGSFNTSSYSIGRDVGNTDNGGSYTYWPGSISEVILYNGSLTTAQRQQVEGYLAWKWGLQANLPAAHPFKLWPPPP